MKIIESDKVRDHCHSTCKQGGPAQKKCNTNLSQKQNNFLPFVIHKFSNYGSHLFFKKLVDKKNENVFFDIIPKTNEK